MWIMVIKSSLREITQRLTNIFNLHALRQNERMQPGWMDDMCADLWSFTSPMISAKNPARTRIKHSARWIADAHWKQTKTFLNSPRRLRRRLKAMTRCNQWLTLKEILDWTTRNWAMRRMRGSHLVR